MIGPPVVSWFFGVLFFPDFGHDVICVDKDPAKNLKSWNRASVRSMSPALDDLMARRIRCRRLSFTGDLKKSLWMARMPCLSPSAHRPRRGTVPCPILTMSWRPLKKIAAELIRLRRASSPNRRPCGHQPPRSKQVGPRPTRRQSSMSRSNPEFFARRGRDR